ncbi:MAG: universal stress protein [Candidatus Odinarchaeia archaeon]
MFSKILFPTDFSSISLKAVDYVKRLKDAGTREVIVLHVIDSYEFEVICTGCRWLGLASEKNMREIENNLRRNAKKELAKIRDEISAADVSVRAMVEVGIPHRKILEVADRENVSLIIMGSHGKGILKQVPLGSVSENVVRHSKKPVLIMK